jgi:hypothetical protein
MSYTATSFVLDVSKTALQNGDGLRGRGREGKVEIDVTDIAAYTITYTRASQKLSAV